jgi:hypothetical protein
MTEPTRDDAQFDEALVEAMAKGMWEREAARWGYKAAAPLTWDAGDEGTQSIWREMARAALSIAVPRVREMAWQPTHRHRKGGLYRVVARGRIEADLSPVVIYEARDGTTWVRPEAEFDDGRFTAIRQHGEG